MGHSSSRFFPEFPDEILILIAQRIPPEKMARFKGAAYATILNRRDWTISATKFRIAHDNGYWNTREEPTSIFGSVKVLGSVCWVEVRHDLPLPPGHFKCTWHMKFDGRLPSEELPHFDVQVDQTMVLSKPFPVEIHGQGYIDWDLGEFDVPISPTGEPTTPVHVSLLEFSSQAWKSGIFLDYYRMTRLDYDPLAPCKAIRAAISRAEQEAATRRAEREGGGDGAQ
ncbi:hypothetical protein PAPYR_6080 [Paratrimastix pyriformis]|uniref:F-box domain-containing protein n=1 Tax=Paratrimastix pyriformis TaxID=342808 RepID=A0ABQ8UG66_9EUKA|nr:hypothetical protein PAPYR_6080 [Paratrimastix pyriformis]